MDDALDSGARPDRLLQRIKNQLACIERDTRQPTMRRANTSITNAT